jgi:hypothetical protein
MEVPAHVGIVVEMSRSAGKARIRQDAQRKSGDYQSNEAL